MLTSPAGVLPQPLSHGMDSAFTLDHVLSLIDGDVTDAGLAALPLLEEYRLLRTLGRGAMGQVFLVHDCLLDRTVAIKFLLQKKVDAQAKERFFIEARSIARLPHPNVVGIYRIGQVQGHLFLVSEYVRGQTLDRLAKPVPKALLFEIARGLLRGLCAAHQQGILHRDLKPGNAILAEDGTVKLLDFGLAKLDPSVPASGLSGLEDTAPELRQRSVSSESWGAVGLTQTGALVGTVKIIHSARR